MENPFFFDEHFEEVEALLGFLDYDPSLFSIDNLFQNDGNYLPLPSPKRHRSCSNAYMPEQPPPLVQPNVDSITMQSVAARNRRRRIGEKMQELGRLIPGGAKMNTGDMLQAAHKYVKFLQAQLAILQLSMEANVQECRRAKEEEEHLQVLLASVAIQERLAAEGMCIVPEEMVYELAADPQLILDR